MQLLDTSEDEMKVNISHFHSISLTFITENVTSFTTDEMFDKDNKCHLISQLSKIRQNNDKFLL